MAQRHHSERAAGSHRIRGGPGSEHDAAVATSTKERILDVALELFIEKGYEGTSLREIAEELGVTKAALYYHYASKDDILMALHMRLHEFGREHLQALAGGPIDLAGWESLLTALLDEMLAQRKLFLLHERNQAALEALHREEHEAEHADIQELVRKFLGDPAIPLRQRARMASAFGAVFAVLFLTGSAFDSSSDEELRELLGDTIRDILRSHEP